MIKRLMDIIGAATGLLLALPVIICVAGLVRARLGSPVLFLQERPGLHGQTFQMMKFRTMIDARAPDGTQLSDAERLVPFGRWLRSTSLDELPGLWSVLRGDMSFVGPRPLLKAYLPRYTAQQARRHEVRPGLTGWAQVNGRNSIGWDEKFALDIWYVDHRSLFLDIKILFLTVWMIVRREGISGEGEATMSEFMGSTASGEEAVVCDASSSSLPTRPNRISRTA